MQVLQIERIEQCATWLESNADKYEQVQSITVLIEDVGRLVNVLAFANGQMAIAKRKLNEAKKKVYESLIASQRAAGFELSPMLARDYVSTRIAEEQYAYDMAERCSRTATHTLEALRTCISALKEEVRSASWGQV
jgi:hypothetical protein